MPEIWIWNSIARRRRSASDTFEENGIQIIKQYMELQGHHVRVIDWATSEGYNSLSPKFFTKLNKYIFLWLVNHPKRNPLFFILSLKSLWIQFILSSFQAIRMKKKLRFLAKEVRNQHIRFFGIKVWYGEAFTWAKYLTVQIQKFSPETIVIAGGYHATLYQEDLLQYSSFDLAVIDEGEYILNDLLNLAKDIPDKLWGKDQYVNLLLQKLEDNPMPGLIFRDHGEICKIPRSFTREIDSQKAVPHYKTDSSKVKVHIIIESLGCPWNTCNFCVHNQFVPVYKTRQIDAIINEISFIISQGIGLFRFTGSDTPPQYGKSIAVAILTKGIQIEFSMGCRAVRNSKNPKIYDEIVDCFSVMLRAGLRGVFIGGETGHDRINEVIMNKGLTSEDLIHTISAIREAEQITGIKLTVSLALIYPTPLIADVTDEDVIRDNLTLLNLSRPDSVIISPPGPFKNSTWFNEKGKFGFQLGDDIIPKLMEYEYVLYKPLTMWPHLNVTLHDKTFTKILAESQRFRQIVEKGLGIPTDLTDEHFLMIRSAGLLSPEGIKQFKLGSMVSIVTGDYAYLDHISSKVNDYSRAMALCNF
jgi:hypothetical protein